MKYSVDDLVLKEEVLNAIEKRLFHIYTVNHISDCIEILFQDDYITDNDRTEKDILKYIKDKMMKTLEAYNNILKESRCN